MTTPSGQLLSDIAAGFHGHCIGILDAFKFNALRNFAKGVDGADTGSSAELSTKIVADTRALAASGVDTLDLAATFATFTTIHGVLIRNKNTNAGGVANINSLAIGNAATHPAALWFSSGADVMNLEAGKTFELSSTAGWAIVEGTNSLLMITNGATNPATYDIVVWGT